MAEKHSRILGLILAAGKGTRMKNALPKPLVPLNSKPLVSYLINTLHNTGVSNIALVVGHGAVAVKAHFGNAISYVTQPEQHGTAHAVQCAIPLIRQYDKVLILMGDNPLLRVKTVRDFIRFQGESESPAAIMTGHFERHFPYARVIRNTQGSLLKCVEERDATEIEKRITEYMTSQFLFETAPLLEMLPQVPPHPLTGEIYLTDLINLYLRHNHPVGTFTVDDYQELVGLNTPEDVVWAEKVLATRSD